MKGNLLWKCEYSFHAISQARFNLAQRRSIFWKRIASTKYTAPDHVCSISRRLDATSNILWKKKQKIVVRWSRLRGPWWAESAAARYPSTVGSGQLSLLCEESGAGRTEEGGELPFEVPSGWWRWGRSSISHRGPGWLSSDSLWSVDRLGAARKTARAFEAAALETCGLLES